jgi:hypothetical protein
LGTFQRSLGQLREMAIYRQLAETATCTKLCTIEQFSALAITYRVYQPALASLGGSDGELRRVDAEAT